MKSKKFFFLWLKSENNIEFQIKAEIFLIRLEDVSHTMNRKVFNDVRFF